MKNMNHSFHVAQFGGLNFDTGRKGVAVFLAFLKIRIGVSAWMYLHRCKNTGVPGISGIFGMVYLHSCICTSVSERVYLNGCICTGVSERVNLHG